MQTLTEIRELLAAARVSPNRRLGQSFLIDGNLMGKLLELAGLTGGETVLEIGAATGSLTEELLEAAGRVVAVELDDTLAGILRSRLGDRESLTILNCDVLAGKHAPAPAVLDALAAADGVHLVSNLPYNVAVPVVVNCLLNSWRALMSGGEEAVRFDRLTFTVQRELLNRLTAGTAESPGGECGPASVIVALLARATVGRTLPPQAFWPRPKVVSQMLRLDFDAESAAALDDAGTLQTLLSATFGHRRKRLLTACKTRRFPYRPEAFAEALAEADIDGGRRPQELRPRQFRDLANALRRRQAAADVVE